MAAPPTSPCRRRPGPEYEPRNPAATVLHRVLREHLETFLGRAALAGRNIPRFVERELRGYLECGILAHGFVRVHCDDCGKDRVVGFSCKGRGFCPSCGGRRMADTAAHLVDRVLPPVPVRQWVLTLPFPLRLRMAYDSQLASAVLDVFLRAVFASLRRRARQEHLIRYAHPGAVTFVQRFGDALNLNVHFHALVLDGVYEAHPDRPFRFHPVDPPGKEELERILKRIVTRLRKLLERRGLDADLLDEDEPSLVPLYAASLRHRSALGPRAGRPARRRGDAIDPEDLIGGDDPYCVQAAGLSLHAGVAVPARDRERLERLCRYVARPPVATERLSRLPDGQLLYKLKRRWRDGTTHVVFEPEELIERLVTLIPPPRAHQVRYHGILAPNAGRRPDLAREVLRSWLPAEPIFGPPSPPTPPVPADQRRAPLQALPKAPDVPESEAKAGRSSSEAEPTAVRERRLCWAELMKRVFAVDVLSCPDCGGRMRLLAAIHNPAAARAILECLDLPSRPPPNEPPRPLPEQADLYV